MGAHQSLATLGQCGSQDDMSGDVVPQPVQQHYAGGALWNLILGAEACAGDPCEARASLGGIKYMGGHMEKLLQELFDAHDLNKNGLLEEAELIQLNKKIAVLHHGKDVDLNEVKDRYQALFRKGLSASGDPVPFSSFRKYVLSVLEEADPDLDAQEMVLEQWLAEARSARMMFHMPSMASLSDAPFLSTISFDESIFGKSAEPARLESLAVKGIEPDDVKMPSAKDYSGFRSPGTASTAATARRSTSDLDFSMSPLAGSNLRPASFDRNRPASFDRRLHAVPPPPPAAQDPWS
mmetsp:Transcript_59853/g.106419  ORF Transcript_59853/g.106419 Transcript_59853/m.106419 type:complete len:294 (+) Transcript_59853:94-975(+)|eukprot:CAMPEP_0197660338 /NCGR_PEP_ID=MMETSP1338-20131121/50789_1 /TAXON_ID=43686 ORGANISM="Pelagodinium beii, Strain RCC1491" /NCGR_SAMPLE_ID=MMETSP1338 /ASSEMBLY_ACC=CAM_ASM_000754 /LENGTH=293 /DNA_ID=CAMNT_0043237671 /DNA_START=83 /DNA_END=964 /DNA_ORIENTATION=+